MSRVPDYNYYPEFYENKYFNNIRDQQWVPVARDLFETKQEQIQFYYDNQEFIESHKKVMNNVHMGWIYMMFKPLNEVDEESKEDYAVYKYLNSEPLSFWA
jgi:hypothetical protein